MTLDGRVSVVTGAGRGIGEAIARELAARGASVVLGSRTAGDVARVAQAITDAGGRAWSLACDVTDEANVAELQAFVSREAGAPADILVNNAGVASSAPIGRTSLEEWNRLLAINATGTFLCMRAFIGDMVDRGSGRVINIASTSGLVGARYVSAYTAAKHAVIGLTRSVAREVGSKGVTVNAVCPGYVDTPMTARSIENIGRKTGRSPDDARAYLESLSGHGRLVKPEEVADAVCWLAGDGAASVNGEAIPMDGGGFRG